MLLVLDVEDEVLGEVDSEDELEFVDDDGDGVVELNDWVSGFMPVRSDWSCCCCGLMPWASMNWVRAEAMFGVLPAGDGVDDGEPGWN